MNWFDVLRLANKLEHRQFTQPDIYCAARALRELSEYLKVNNEKTKEPPPPWMT